MNGNKLISEQTVLECFGEPLTKEEMTKSDWSTFKVEKKKTPKKKSGPKPSFWGARTAKKAKKAENQTG
jgi:hypothetical protein